MARTVNVATLRSPLIADTSQFTKKMRGANKLAQGMKKTLLGLGRVAIGVGATAFTALAAGAVASTKTAISVESAFAGVAKTTDGLVNATGEMTEQGRKMRDEFRGLARDVPIAVEELMGIGETAGQLGVAEQAIVGFSGTVANLAITTNLTQQSAATDLAKIANIYEVSGNKMAANTENMGNVIVELGNNLSTNESDIVSFASRIAGVSKTAGIAQPDILAIGAAFSSVGIPAARGGTAVQKSIITMMEAVKTGGKEVEIFADVAGQSVEEFSNSFEKDAAGAFQDFVEGLGEQGDDAISVLEELGLSDQRLIQSMLSLAGSSETLAKSREMANEQMEDGNALEEEAAKRFATTESKIQLLKNRVRDMGIAIGDKLLPPFNEFLTMLSDKALTLIPKVEEFVEGKLLPALEGIGSYAKNIALPALGELWDFTQDFVIPQLKDWWNHALTLKDNLKKLYKTITTSQAFENLRNSFNNIKSWWDSNGKEIINAAGNVWEAIKPSKATEQRIGKFIENLTGYFEDFTNDLEKFELADKINNVADGINNMKPALSKLGVVVETWGMPILTFFATLFAIFKGAAVFGTIAAKFGVLATAAGELGAGVSLVAGAFTSGGFMAGISALVLLVGPLAALAGAFALLGFVLVKFGSQAKNTLWMIWQIIKIKTNQWWMAFKAWIDKVKASWRTNWQTMKEFIIEVWTSIKTFIITKFVEIVDNVKGKLGELKSAIKTKLEKARSIVKNKLGKIKKGFNGVRDAVGWAASKVGALISKLKSLAKLNLRKWMPGSPTPFELGIRGASDALKELSNKRLNNLQGELKALAGSGDGEIGIAGGKQFIDNSQVIQNNYNQRAAAIATALLNQQRQDKINEAMA